LPCRVPSLTSLPRSSALDLSLLQQAR
jgi:hypothetical protein